MSKRPWEGDNGKSNREIFPHGVVLKEMYRMVVDMQYITQNCFDGIIGKFQINSGKIKIHDIADFVGFVHSFP